jgi:hypothetical protein
MFIKKQKKEHREMNYGHIYIVMIEVGSVPFNFSYPKLCVSASGKAGD